MLPTVPAMPAVFTVPAMPVMSTVFATPTVSTQQSKADFSIQCINSIYKLIQAVHAAILYNQLLPIDILYVRKTDRHIYKCYARLYYIVTGEYLYCDKFISVISQGHYTRQLNQLDVCWPRYWLIEIGTFDVVCDNFSKSAHLRVLDNFVNVYLSNSKALIYTQVTNWYGVSLKYLANTSLDAITVNKAELPIAVRPSLFAASDMMWFVPTYEIHLDKAKLCRIVLAIIDKKNVKLGEYDDLYIRKQSKFRVNRKKNEYNQMSLIQQIAGADNVSKCL